MKFCPNCGSVREDKDVCNCGYDYNTGKVKEQEKKEDNANLFMFMKNNGVSLEVLKQQKLDFGDLLYFSFVSSGGMMGSYYSSEISFKESLLTVVEQQWHHGDKIKKVYKVDEKVSKELKKILIDNNFGAWNQVPINNGMIAFDAPTSSMYLRYENRSVSVLTTICMDKEMSEVYFKVRDMINESIKEENKISEEKIVEGEEMRMAMMDTNSSKFCPECGKKLNKEDTKCPCGYEVVNE